MAEQIGALVARVVADNESFRADLLKMGRQLDSATGKMNRSLDRVNRGMSRMGSVARTVTGLMGALGVAFSVRQIAAFVSQTVQAARELHSLSARLGATVEALSELQYVAEQSDVQFNVMSLGLQRMTRRIAEAAEGTGEAKGALEELGLSAALLVRLPLDEQFENVADRLSRVESEAHRVRLAMKLFDSEGVALIQTMSRGAAGIREMREEARQLGVTLNTEAATAAAKAAEESEKFRAATNALARDLTVKLLPALTQSIEGWRQFLFPTQDEDIRQRLDEAYGDIRRIQLQIAGEAPSLWKSGAELQRDLEEARARVGAIHEEIKQRALQNQGEDRFATLRLPNLEQMREAEQILQRMALSQLSQGVTPEGGFPARKPELGAPGAHETMREAEASLTQFIQEQHDKRVTSAARAAAEEAQVVLESQQAQYSFRNDLATASAELLYALLGESKAVAFAQIAFEKLQAVRRVKIAVEQAAWLAFASQLIPGDPTSLARAQAARAAVRAQGAVTVARTIALSVISGLAEAARVGGSSGAPGSFTNPLSVRGGSTAAGGVLNQQGRDRSQSVVQIIFRGDVYGWDDYIQTKVAAGLREAMTGKDVVIIERDSRQAQLLGAPA